MPRPFLGHRIPNWSGGEELLQAQHDERPDDELELSIQPVSNPDLAINEQLFDCCRVARSGCFSGCR